MSVLASGMDYVDLNFVGLPGIIATAILKGPGGVALIDPGPSSTLDGLLKSLSAQGIAVKDIRQVVLTHIHLDHSGATGSLLGLNPEIEVYVHERGARHLVDPSKLLASATRLYGGDMDRLWGDVLPVPAGCIRQLGGGERLTAGGRQLEVAATPGHASHHVCFFDRSSGVAFVGDTAGIRRGAGTYVMPPTPPPDIDLEAWRRSGDRIMEWDPDTLFLTHFGSFRGARTQFQELFERIDAWSALVRRLLADSTIDDAERERRFVEQGHQDIRRTVGPTEAEQYSRAGRLDYSWQGLARYWRSRLG